MSDEPIWTIILPERAMAVLMIAFALWIFLTLALMRSVNELKRRLRDMPYYMMPRTRFSRNSIDDNYDLLAEREEERDNLAVKIKWPDEEDEPFLEEYRERLEELEEEIKELEEELGLF